MGTVLAYALQALQYIPQVIALGIDVKNWITGQVTLINAMQAAGRDPTTEEWDALHAVMKAESDRLQGA